MSHVNNLPMVFHKYQNCIYKDEATKYFFRIKKKLCVVELMKILGKRKTINSATQTSSNNFHLCYKRNSI